MNMQTAFNYYIRDAKEGIRRNLGAAACAAALIFITLTVSGTLLLLRYSADDMMRYLESQVSMKVYIDPSLKADDAARILGKLSFVKSAVVETREQLLERLKFFFEGREHLMTAFMDSPIPDAVVLELTEIGRSDQIAEELRAIQGITEVVYPQQLAQTVVHWSNRLNRVGAGLFLILAAVAYLTVFIATRLAMFQRLKEIRVKLLLGANPAHVRGQFMFEGLLVSLMASLAAALAVYGVFSYVLLPVERQFHWVFHYSADLIYPAMLAITVAGPLLGVSASYFSTRKLINDV